MLRIKYRRPVLFVCFLCFVLGSYAQYVVKGGSGTPLLAKTETRLEVYLVYGVQNVEISYTSSSTSHQWYRYKTKSSEAERITSEQSGNTSTIRNIEDGYGYFVEEGGGPAGSNFVWIIDYSKYAFTVGNLRVAESSDPCSGVRLEGDVPVPAMRYSMPFTGMLENLERTFEVSYTTMENTEEDKIYRSVNKTETVVGDIYGTRIGPPLADTDFVLRGDDFARHFGVEQVAQTNTYDAVAIAVTPDTTLVINMADNMLRPESGYSLPATIRFMAYANTPVAAFFQWRIYRKESGRDNYEVLFTGEELEHTFRKSGDYVAELEVADRTALCSEIAASYEFQLSETLMEIPNAFSPGTTPGVNDEFRVAYKSVSDFKGWIFNRWGVEMFKWDDPAKGWDGKKGGKYVPPGVYFYVIQYKDSEGKSKKRTGHINILRSKTIQDEIIE